MASHRVLELLVLAIGAMSVFAQDSTRITITVNLKETPDDNGRPVFGAAFKTAFAAAVGVAGCTWNAPMVYQDINFFLNGATISFTYPLTAKTTKGVGYVLANPGLWFSRIDTNTIYGKALLKYMSLDQTGLIATASEPQVFAPAGPGGCAPVIHPPPSPPPPSPPPPPPPPPPSPPAALAMPMKCDAVSAPYAVIFSTSAVPAHSTQRRLARGLEGAVKSALMVAQAKSWLLANVTIVRASFDAEAFKLTLSFVLDTCLVDSWAIQQISNDATYFLLRSTQVALDFQSLGHIVSVDQFVPRSSVSPPPSPPPPSPPSPPPSPPAALPPPPPVFNTPEQFVSSMIRLSGNVQQVSGRGGEFRTELRAALAGLFCTSYDNVWVSGITFLVGDTYNLAVNVRIGYTPSITFKTSPATCQVISYISLAAAFSGDAAQTPCFVRILSQDPSFSKTWGPIGAGVCSAV